MLAKKFRLPSKDIPLVLKSGKRQNLKLFLVYSSFSQSPQFSIIVSNKIDKRATQRNKIKRRLKEAIAKNLDKFQDKKVIFIAKKEILNAKFTEILCEINNLTI